MYSAQSFYVSNYDQSIFLEGPALLAQSTTDRNSQREIYKSRKQGFRRRKHVPRDKATHGDGVVVVVVVMHTKVQRNRIYQRLFTTATSGLVRL